MRLLLIALILAIGVVWPQYGPAPTTARSFLPLIVFWITLGTIHIILLRWIPDAPWHGALQVISDVADGVRAGLRHRLAGQLFHFLYLLVIIVGSILFSRRAAFGVATLSSCSWAG